MRSCAMRNLAVCLLVGGVGWVLSGCDRESSAVSAGTTSAAVESAGTTELPAAAAVAAPDSPSQSSTAPPPSEPPQQPALVQAASQDVPDDETAPPAPAEPEPIRRPPIFLSGPSANLREFEPQNGAPRGMANVPEGVFYLDLHDRPQFQNTLLKGSLFRELPRQAMLMAARDELGMSTRDRSLREQFPWSQMPETWPLSVITSVTPDYMALVTVIRHTPSGVDVWWEQQFPLDPQAPYESLATVAERLAREDFRALLVDLEYADRRTHAGAAVDGTASSEALELLSQMTDIAQFAAVRRLHAEIRDEGESTERLGCLARGYANLSVLTDAYTGCMYKACMARALLYAERAVAADRESPVALRDRAYVRALIGLPEAASQDLVEARRLAGASMPPDWVSAVEAFCAGRGDELITAADGESDVLRAFLFWKLQQNRSDDQNEYAALGSVLANEPDCLRMMFQVAAIRSLGTKAAARTTLAWLPEAVERQLPKVGDLPSEVTESLEREDLGSGAAYSEMVRLLKQQGLGGKDRSEPSLDLLGQLLNEAGFLCAWQVLDYYQYWLSVPVDREGPELAAWGGGHPYAGALELRTANRGRWQDGGRELLKRMQRSELEWWDSSVVREFFNADTHQGHDNDRVIREHFDMLVPEICALLGVDQTASSRLKRLENLKRIAPRLPATLEWRISLQPGALDSDFEQLEEQYSGDVSLQQLLSKSYVNRGDVDGAERCARRWIELRPGYAAWQQLADIAALRGDEQAWLAAIDAALEEPVPGLEHAETGSKVARYFLDRSEPERALPYAEGAAATGAAWAMLRAAEVHDALGHWDESNEYRQATARRYPDQSVNWYFWCLRMGKGDIDEAERAARDYLLGLGDRSIDDEMRLAILEIVSENSFRSYERTQRLAHIGNEPYYAWFAFVLADLRDDDAVRQEMLQLVIDTSRNDGIFLAGTDAIAGYLQEWFAAGAQTPLDRALLDREIAKLRDNSPTNMWFFLSQVLQQHGSDSDSLEYLRRAALSPATDLWTQYLAAHLMRSDGQELGELRSEQFVPVLPPDNETHAHILQLDGTPRQVRFEGQSSKLLVTDPKGAIHAWDPESGADSEWLPGRGWLGDVSPADETAAIIPNTVDRIEIWRGGSDQAVQELPGVGVRVNAVRFLPDDPNRLVRTDSLLNSETVPQTVLAEWDIAESRELWRAPLGRHVIYGIGLANEDHEVVLAGRNPDGSGWLGTFSAADGSEIRSVNVPRHPVSRLAVAADGLQAATLSERGEIIIWDLSTLEAGARLWLSGAVEVALCSQPRLLAVSVGSEIRLYDLERNELITSISDHFQPISNLRLSPDGRFLASAAADMTARVWDVAELRDQGPTPAAPAMPVLIEPNSIGMMMIPVPAGDYMMGERDEFVSTPYYQRGAVERGRPRHHVVLTRPFYLSQFEVTVGQFREFVRDTGYQTEAERKPQGATHFAPPTADARESPEWNWTNPGFQQDDTHPVVTMSFNDVQRFCEWLSVKEGRRYRLPTEAEWEYACRAGTQTSWCSGNYYDSIKGYGNSADLTIAEHYDFYGVAKQYDDGFPFSAPVGSYLPNNWGFYDMHGNAYEWCRDFFSMFYYKDSPEQDPTGPQTGSYHTQRGGSFFNHSDDTRSAHRDFGKVDETQSAVGFRVVREID